MYWNLSQFLSIIGDIYAPNLLLCRFSIHFSSSIRQFVLLPCVASVCSTRFCARLECLFICVIYTIMSHNVYNVYHKYLHIRSRIWLFLFVTQDWSQTNKLSAIYKYKCFCVCNLIRCMVYLKMKFSRRVCMVSKSRNWTILRHFTFGVVIATSRATSLI